MGKWLDRLFEALCSLKLAVLVILALTTSLATATVLESIYDTPTAQYFVYRSLWFHAVLASLGVNIFCVAVSRWPWKPRHIPFLLAHAGILMLLGGSWATERFGLDGSVRVSEGEAVNAVELDERALVVTDSSEIHKIPVRWVPPDVKFKPITAKNHGVSYDLTIDKMHSHADATFSFIPATAPPGGRIPRAGIQLRLQGGPMNITQDFWLWEGDPSFKAVSMGPASFGIGTEQESVAMPGRPTFRVIPEKGGALSYRAFASDGKTVSGRMTAKEATGKVIQPGWKGGVKLTVLDWVPDAFPLTSYHPARIQYGMQAPSSAIHVISGAGGEGAETWLGVGDRAMLHTPTGKVELAYLPQRIALPFSVRLDLFKIDRYEGTIDPSSYSSNVTVYKDRAAKEPSHSTVISMNEPLTVGGITLYQSSYEDAQPRPTVSIFSVNQDPGRPWKYLGSLLIVLGSILLFAVKYRKAKSASARVSASSTPEVVA